MYVIVNAALWALGLLLLPHYASYLWVVSLLWGIGLAIHALVFFTSNEDELKQEKEGMAWWLEQQQRRHERAMAMVASRHGAPHLLRETEREKGRETERAKDEAAARQRVEVAPEPAAAKVRVSTDTTRDRMAEEEAELAERRGARRKRR